MRPLLLFACLVLAAQAGEAPDPLTVRDAAIDAALRPYQQAVDQAQKAYDTAVGKARASAITALGTLAKREARKPEKELAIAAWKQVLALDEANPEARAFFAALGTTDAVLEEIERDRARMEDLLAEPVVLPEPVKAEVDRFETARSKEKAAFAKLEGVARTRFRDAEAKATVAAVKSLTTAAGRAEKAGDLALAVTAYRNALALDREHAAARTYLAGLGRLDAILAELPPPRDPLGDPPDPDKGFAPMSLRGLRVALIGCDDRAPLVRRLTRERCEKAGMTVTLLPPDGLRLPAIGASGTPAAKVDVDDKKVGVDQFDLVIAFGLSDATRGSFEPALRAAPVPVVCADVKMFSAVGLMAHPNWSAFDSGFRDSIEVVAEGHPAAAGLSGRIPLLTPLPPQPGAKPLPVEQDPAFVQMWAVAVTPVAGGTPVVGSSVRADASVLVAWEAGTAFPGGGTTRDGLPIETKLPARRVGWWLPADMADDRAQRLSREYWRLWDATMIWAARAPRRPAK